MVSKTKLYVQLDRLESELLERLVPHLEKAAKGENDLVFCTAEFNPFPELKCRTDAETEDLIALGRKILALNKKLGEDSHESVAEKLCEYCRRWGDTGNSHRKAAQGIACEFLQDIGSATN